MNSAPSDGAEEDWAAELTERRFPPPWIVEELEACFYVCDSTGQKLAYVYFEDESGRRAAAKLLTRDERIAANIRQAAGAIVERLNVMREQMKGSDRCFRCAPKLGLDYCFGVVSPPPRRFSRRS